MSHRLLAPHEEELEAALRRLEPATFQQFVERYAQIRWPKRFPSLIPIGRNTTATTKNWPDAISLAPGGKLHALEVTHARQWLTHLEHDVEQISNYRDHIASFMFVGWASPKADDSRPSELHQQIVDLGVDTEFVFGKQLVRDLKDPCYAPLWMDLGLAISSDPLELIGRAELFGGDDLESYQPTKAEYVEGRVHRSSAFDAVTRQLREQHYALVRGEGASGKTVLATQIAFSSDYYDEDQPHVVYYVDLAHAAEHPDLHQAFASRAPAARLIIVDNVHLAAGVAAGLFDTWRSLRATSPLLLLGREVDVTNVKGARSPLAELEDRAIPVRVTAADLRGVYQRIAGRIGAAGTPSDGDVQQWLSVFGGDLIAFSLAVSRRAKDFAKGDWTLRAADAHDYVTDHYLAGTSAEERETLLRLAVGADVEVPVHADVLDVPPPKHLLQHGIVRRARLDDGIAYSFVHPGFGKLFIAAMPKGDLAAARRAFAGAPFTAHMVAYRLYSSGRVDEAGEIMREFRDPARCEALLLTTAYVSPCILLVSLGICTVEEMEARGRLVLDRIVARVIARTPHRLLGQVAFLRSCVPALADALLERLTEPATFAQWLDVAVTAPPDQITGLLKVLRRYLHTPDLTHADRYLSKKTEAIAQLVSAATIPDLVNFAAARKSGFPRVCACACRAMTRDADAVLTKAVAAVAADPVRGLVLVNRLAGLAGGVLGERLKRVQPDRDAVRRTARASGLHTFLRTLSFLEQNGADLVHELADDEVREPVPSRWSSRCPINHVSHVARLATGTTAEERDRFVVAMLSEEALREFYDRVHDETLARAMFNVWLDGSIARERLLVDELALEIERRLDRLPPDDTSRLADAARLLAISALFELPRLNYAPVDDALLDTMCRTVALPTAAKLRDEQLLVWLGIRRLGLPIDPGLAAQALRFDTPAELRPAKKALYDDVRAWLQSMETARSASA